MLSYLSLIPFSSLDRINLLCENQKSHSDALSQAELNIKTMSEKNNLNMMQVDDVFRKTEIRFQDTESMMNLKLKSFKDELCNDQHELYMQVKNDMDNVHDSVSGNLEELRSKVNTLINSDIASSTR